MKNIDLTGKRFAKLVVLNKVSGDKFHRSMWLCKCDCGKYITAARQRLLKGITKSCGCFKGGKCQSLVYPGAVFNYLTVIEFDINSDLSKHKGSKYYRWICKCVCGTIKSISAACLVTNETKSCGCTYSQWTGHEEISGTFFSSIKNTAIKRNLEFCITIEQVWELFLKQNRKCALSGLEIRFGENTLDRNKTASLDRIDSSKGYTIDNIQWVHKNVNFMKQDMSDEEFINFCKIIANYNK